MLSGSREIASNIAEAMSDVYSGTGVEFKTYISAVEPRGVRVT
jgi:hypothetical protein